MASSHIHDSHTPMSNDAVLHPVPTTSSHPQQTAPRRRLSHSSSHTSSRPRHATNALALGRTASHTSTNTRKKAKWWDIQWGRGIVNDIRRRAPFYVSDWRDAWDYRVVPATVYMYFAKYVAFVLRRDVSIGRKKDWKKLIIDFCVTVFYLLWLSRLICEYFLVVPEKRRV